MKVVLAFVVLVALLVSVLEAARTTDSLLYLYEFPQSDCAVGSFSASSGGSEAIGIVSSIAGGTRNLCTARTVSDVAFSKATRGFDSGKTAFKGGVKSAGDVTSTVFESAFTLEYWLTVRSFPTGSQQAPLFEIGQSTAPTTAPITWTKGTHFDLRFTLVNNLDVRFDFTGLVTANGPQFLSTLPTNTLMHLVFTFTPESPNVRIKSFRDGVQQGSGVLVLSQFTAGLANQKVFLGGSNGIGINANDVALNGDIHLFAAYSKELTPTEVLDNFNAAPKLLNSLPSPGVGQVNHFEDGTTVLDFGALTFDYDNVQFSSGNVLSKNITTLPTRGQLTDTGNSNHVVVALDLPYTISGDTNIQYTQTTANEDSGVDSFQFKVSDEEGSSIDSGTLTLAFRETNDFPIAAGDAVTIPEFREFDVLLTATDPLDFGDFKNTSFFPEFFSITSVTSTVGTFLEVNPLTNNCSNGTALVPPVTTLDLFGSISNNSAGVFSFKVCYRANGNAIAGPDAFVGSDAIFFTATDGSGLTSGLAFSNVSVSSALAVGCGVIGELPCETFYKETDTDMIMELQATDNRCDGETPDLGCETRIKKFFLIAPLPDPDTEGVIVVEGASGEDIIVTDALVAGSGFLVPNNSNVIRFVAVDNYVNLGHHPICSGGINGQGDCSEMFPDGISSNIQSTIACKGNFCAPSVPNRYTTDDINRSPIGGCQTTLGLINQGCPIRIFYELEIGTGRSAPRDDPAQILWIANVFKGDDESIVITQEGGYDGFEPETARQISFNSPTPISVISENPNLNNMRMKIDLVTITGEEGFLYCPASILNPLLNDKISIFKSDCLFNGCNASTSVFFVGSSLKMNQLLESLIFQYQLDVKDGTAVSVELQLQLSTPFSFSNSGVKVAPSELVTLTIGEEKKAENNIWKQARFLAIVGAALILILMCCISYMEAAGRCTKRNTRACCNARRIARRNGNLQAFRDMKREERRRRRSSMQSEAEEVLKNIQSNIKAEANALKESTQALRMMAVLCPCFCGLDEEQKKLLKNRGGDEDQEEIRREVGARMQLEHMAKKRPHSMSIKTEAHFETGNSIWDWEKYEDIDPKTNKHVVYYYNKVTDKSQWHSPFPNQEIQEGTKKPISPQSEKHVTQEQAQQRPQTKRLAPAPPKLVKGTEQKKGMNEPVVQLKSEHGARKTAKPPMKPKKNGGGDGMIAEDIDKAI